MIRAHLPECAECREDLARLSEAAAVLALTVDEVVPPARLRQRIKTAVSGENTLNAGLAADTIELAERAQRIGIRPRLRSTWVPAQEDLKFCAERYP